MELVNFHDAFCFKEHCKHLSIIISEDKERMSQLAEMHIQLYSCEGCIHGIMLSMKEVLSKERLDSDYNILRKYGRLK